MVEASDSDASRPAHPLEPDTGAMRALGDAALELVVRFIEARDEAPAIELEGAAERARELRAPPPEEGVPLEWALATIERAAGKAIDTAGPGYLAYIPGGGVYASAIGEMIAQATNRYTAIPAIAPPMAAIETSVIDWLCRTFDLPGGAGGVLTTGGSLANFSAVVAARETLGEDLRAGAIYASSQAHQSVARAARLAGFPARSLRQVPCDSKLRMDPTALERMLEEDRGAGLTPCMLVATAGTTNTGAIDPLGELAAIAEREHVWLHVDAAYGGFFQLTGRGRTALSGIERADSIVLDPHKGMFLPYGTGCLLVRDAERLRRSHALGGDYLQDLGEHQNELPSFAQLSPELSRENRGLRVWLPLQLHGVGAFRQALDEKLDLARYAHQRLTSVPELELPWNPQLSIVAFRLRDGDDHANRRLLERINASRRIFLSSTVIEGRYTLRMCVLSFRTHRERIDEAVDLIARAAVTAAAV